MTDKHRKVAQEVCYQVKQLPEILGILLFGSIARGDASKTSDVDLLVVAASTPQLSRRQEVIDQLKDPGCFIDCTDTPRPFGHFNRQDIGVDLVFYEEREIEQILEHIKHGERLSDSKLPAAFQYGEILFDCQDKLKQWVQAVHPIPKHYLDRIIPCIFADVCAVVFDLHDIEHEESLFYIHSELLSVVAGVIELIFLSNGRYYEKSHHLNKILNEFDIPKRFLSCINEVLWGDSSSPSLLQKWRAIAELSRLVGEVLDKQDQYELTDGWNELKNNAPFVFAEKNSVVKAEKQVQVLGSPPNQA